MTTWLRLLGVAVLALGVGGGSYAATRAVGDTAWTEIAAQYARHPEHALFQGEYWTAAARHYGLLAGTVGGFFGGLAVGGIRRAPAEPRRGLPARAPRRRAGGRARRWRWAGDERRRSWTMSEGEAGR